MLENKKCPECGGDIVIQYITPTKSYRIENGKFVRDDAWIGEGYDDSYLCFICSQDMAHEIEPYDDLINGWMIQTEEKFIKEVLNNE